MESRRHCVSVDFVLTSLCVTRQSVLAYGSHMAARHGLPYMVPRFLRGHDSVITATRKTPLAANVHILVCIQVIPVFHQ